MVEEEANSLFKKKIKTAVELREIIGDRPRKRIVIMCHGTFDIVHPGHIRHLIYAKSKGDILIASLTCDQHIMKANFRPYVPESLRALNLAALEIVDYVVIDQEPTPLKNLGIIQPDYFAKGYEYVAGATNPKTQEEINILESYGGEIIFTPGDVVYSSSKFLETSPPNLSIEKLLALMSAEKVTFADLRKSLRKISGKTVHVVGDTIVDSYTYCSMIGGMTKTPTMSVRFERRDNYVGGAGIVAKHLRAAGASVIFSTVLGKDELADFVLDDLKKCGVECRPLIDESRPTTNKDAIIAENYRLLKVDTVDNRAINDRMVGKLAATIASTKADAIVFSDFRHGMFNRVTIPVLTAAIPAGAFRVADSQVASRWGNILEFQGFDLITPNEREARFALGDQDSVIRPLALDLHRKSNCRTLILKLGDRGLITYRSNSGEDYRAFFTIDSFAEDVKDPVGAGDALLAYASLSLLATGNDVIASILGALAAAVECACDGNMPVTQDDVLKKIDALEGQADYAS